MELYKRRKTFLTTYINIMQYKAAISKNSGILVQNSVNSGTEQKNTKVI
jgi:hypothetical protein